MEGGSYVEYVGEDEPDLHVWRGHPGLVVDIQFWERPEASVSFVGSLSMCVPLDELQELDVETCRQRGNRVIAGNHPLDDRDIDPPITADGWHWP